MDYAGFVAGLAAFAIAGDPTDDTWAAALPVIVGGAELRLLRDLDPVAARATTVLTVAAGSGTSGDLPADWVAGRDVRVQGGPRLSQRDDTFLAEYWPDASVPAGSGVRPKYWADPGNGALVVAPSPAASTALAASYTRRPASLATETEGTYLSKQHPDLLHAAAMAWICGYQKNFGAASEDPRSGLSWEALYRSLLAVAQREEARRKGDGSFDSGPTPPPASNAPGA